MVKNSQSLSLRIGWLVALDTAYLPHLRTPIIDDFFEYKSRSGRSKEADFAVALSAIALKCINKPENCKRLPAEQRKCDAANRARKNAFDCGNLQTAAAIEISSQRARLPHFDAPAVALRVP